MKNRPYIECPFEAAQAAKNFGFKFCNYIRGVKETHRIVYDEHWKSSKIEYIQSPPYVIVPANLTVKKVKESGGMAGSDWVHEYIKISMSGLVQRYSTLSGNETEEELKNNTLKRDTIYFNHDRIFKYAGAEGDECYIPEKHYISPESLPLLEPMVGDLVRDCGYVHDADHPIVKSVKDVGKPDGDILWINLSGYRSLMRFNRHELKIIQRNNKPFPEIHYEN